MSDDAVHKRPVYTSPKVHAVCLQGGQHGVSDSFAWWQCCNRFTCLISNARVPTARLTACRSSGAHCCRKSTPYTLNPPAHVSIWRQPAAHLQGDEQVVAAEGPPRPAVLVVARKLPVVAGGAAAVRLQLPPQEAGLLLQVLPRGCACNRGGRVLTPSVQHTRSSAVLQLLNYRAHICAISQEDCLGAQEDICR
jgi:hypothetical protein